MSEVTALLPATWYAIQGTDIAHYATDTKQDVTEGVVRPVCGGINSARAHEVRERISTDIDCEHCAEKLGEHYYSAE